MAKKNLKGKFIIAFDTICDGWQCATDENGKPAPTLFKSEDEAMFELFADNISMLKNQTAKERMDNGGISKQKFADMKIIFNEGNGNPQHMAEFLEKNPECNYNGEFIVPAEQFIFGRKTIFGSEGLKITGKKL